MRAKPSCFRIRGNRALVVVGDANALGHDLLQVDAPKRTMPCTEPTGFFCARTIGATRETKGAGRQKRKVRVLEREGVAWENGKLKLLGASIRAVLC
jgi:hypothetical protein